MSGIIYEIPNLIDRKTGNYEKKNHGTVEN